MKRFSHKPDYCAIQTPAPKIIFLVLSFLFLFHPLSGQTPDKPPGNMEQQLENNTENNADTESEDDSYLQQLYFFIKHPVNLNYATENEINELRVLSLLQVQSLLSYRKLLGNLISIYELQAIPGWSIALIQKIRPYITVDTRTDVLTLLNKRFRVGGHMLLLRAGQTLERAKGYLIDSPAAANFYTGSPQKILLRYRYQFKKLLQYGVVAEKDAGEQFFKGSQPHGFDFYSVHFFAKDIGIIQSLALGDFTVNMGQGLIQWQNLAFKKSVEITSIKREAAILQPYHAAGEINFHRGAGITWGKRSWQATVFISRKKIDANFIADTTQSSLDHISSIQTSGYHRTKSEIDDKSVQQQVVFGGNLSFRYKLLSVGLNTVQYKFKWPIVKTNEPYNLYAMSGRSLGNVSVDYSYTVKNLHFFGEAAASSNVGLAFVNGLLVSMSATVDMSFLYRNIAPAYQSLYAAAFTESSIPSNEKGFYAGISLHPGGKFKIDGYMDIFHFPWLKYRVNKASGGADYLIQLTYRPGKQLEWYSRFITGNKPVNDNGVVAVISPVMQQQRQNWRTQCSFKITKAIELRSRVELCWVDTKSVQKEQGFLIYQDLFYKPLFKPWAINMRLQYFETGGYNSRLYAFETDVLFSYAVPVFYGKAIKYYVNINYDINKHFSIWLKWAQIFYGAQSLIGSGLDEITGGRKSEIKVQFIKIF